MPTLTLRRTRDYLRDGTSFAVETTLSSHSIPSLIRESGAQGFSVRLIFVAPNDPEKNITRVRARADLGGHFIPDIDVRRRYSRSLANLVEAIRLSDIAEVYDNSGDEHQPVFIAKAGLVTWRKAPLPRWAEFLAILEQNT